MYFAASSLWVSVNDDIIILKYILQWICGFILKVWMVIHPQRQDFVSLSLNDPSPQTEELYIILSVRKVHSWGFRPSLADKPCRAQWGIVTGSMEKQSQY